MKEIKNIAQNLAKTGMMAEKIASVLEMDVRIVTIWLNDAGIDPRNYKDHVYQRQMEGIAAAKARGVKFGRPRVKMPENFADIVWQLDNKIITSREAVQKSGLTEATFYRRLREYRKMKEENVS